MGVITYKKSPEVCRRKLKHARPRLFAAAQVFSDLERHALYSLFAFEEFLNEGTLKAATPGALRNHFKDCQACVDRVFESRRSEFQTDFEPALEQTVLRYEIPRKLLSNAIDGVTLHKFFRQPQSEDEYLSLAYHRSGVWGVILGHVFGAEVPLREAILNLATGLWLTKRVVELPRDLRRNRVYWPLEWFERVSATPEALMMAATSKQEMSDGAKKSLASLYQRAVALARESLDQAGSKRCLVRPWGVKFCTSLALRLANKALDRAERDGLNVLNLENRRGLFSKLPQFARST
jgi:phytoene/squalene synthetase